MHFKKELVLIAAITIILTGVSSWYYAQASRYITFSVEVISETEMEKPIFQLFYDIGSGFNEKNSQSFLLTPDETSQTISYTIPGHSICGLRLDYLNGPGEVTLKNISLHSNSGENIYIQLHTDHVQLNQTENMLLSPRSVQLKTLSTANDPYMYISFEPACSLTKTPLQLADFTFALKTFCILFFGISLLIFLTRQKSTR